VRETTSTSAEKPVTPAASSRVEGELTFINKANPAKTKKIEIEVADNDQERSRGLMDRRSLQESVGMLFIFERAEPQQFWMRNTYIPLDIIFIDANKEIVKIHKYAAPHSVDSYPSQKDALYVVEVNGGFTDKYNIQEGDRITFTLQNRPS
jgi:hypothetical protein